MTYNDPNRRGRANEGWGAGTVATIAIAGVLILGGLVYGLNNWDKIGSTNTGSMTTPTTTGAAVGTTRTNGNAASGTVQIPAPAPGTTGTGNAPATTKP